MLWILVMNMNVHFTLLSSFVLKILKGFQPKKEKNNVNVLNLKVEKFIVKKTCVCVCVYQLSIR